MYLLYDDLHLHFVAVGDAETRRARQHQQRNAVATVTAALQARHKDISLFGVCTCSGIFAAVYCLVTYNHHVFVSALGIYVRLCIDFTDAKAAAAEAAKIAAIVYTPARRHYTVVQLVHNGSYAIVCTVAQ